MRLLLDTHLLLWAAEDRTIRSPAAGRFIYDPENTLFFSVVSLWEVAIKRALNKADFTVDAGTLRTGLLSAGYGEIAVTAPHALAIAALPPIHKDPFDRMLVAQATVERAVLLTSDKTVARYAGPIQLV